eukprot:scaffold240015_cov102-Attheya_sp.AAC.2
MKKRQHIDIFRFAETNITWAPKLINKAYTHRWEDLTTSNSLPPPATIPAMGLDNLVGHHLHDGHDR